MVDGGGDGEVVVTKLDVLRYEIVAGSMIVCHSTKLGAERR